MQLSIWIKHFPNKCCKASTRLLQADNAQLPSRPLFIDVFVLQFFS